MRTHLSLGRAAVETEFNKLREERDKDEEQEKKEEQDSSGADLVLYR